ncbi:MAG: ATP-binding cassette domain-containing protein [Bacteroidota bacterium]|nr:ATP-binding cassette domain-containing protein [Bacteroidota bacterium]
MEIKYSGFKINICTDNEKELSVINIKNLKKSFDNKLVLNNINLSLFKGENLVILGKTGMGKSVLIKCIVGLIEPDEGNIMVLNTDLSLLKQRELDKLRKKMGFLFQNAALYDSMTVRENVAFPLRNLIISKEEKEKKVLEVLESVGLLESINKMPSELSGGMKKRLGLARTLVLKPEIILYDEPTTGLDPVTSKEISELILKMQSTYNITSIIITHDIACARITSNRIIILQKGELIAEGNYNELKNHSSVLVNAFFKT